MSNHNDANDLAPRGADTSELVGTVRLKATPSSADPAPASGNNCGRALAFDQSLAALCVDFISQSFESVADGLNAALQRIGSYTGVDLCYLVETPFDGATNDDTAVWIADGSISPRNRAERLPATMFAWEAERVFSDSPLRCSVGSEPPPQAVGLRWLRDEHGVVGSVSLPMITDGRLIGVLGFCCVGQPRPWCDQDTAVAKVLAELLTSVLHRSRTEQALRASEERFRGIVRDQTDLIVRWKPSGEQRFVNEAVERFLRTPAESILGESVFDSIHPDDLPAVKRKLSGLTIETPVGVDEHRVLKPDGTTAWLHCVDRALFDDRGRLVEYQTVGRDITRLKQSQQELERRLRFEQAALLLSTRFINLAPERFDIEFRDALKLVTELTGVGRSYVYLFDNERKEAALLDEWSAPDIAPMTEAFRVIRMEDFPWAVEAMFGGRPVHIPSMDALPPEAAGFREQIESIGVKAYINVPMVIEGVVYGHLGCTCFDAPKTWSDEEIGLLRLLGEVLINAIRRRETQEALAASEQRLRLTIESVEEGVFDWDIETGRTYISDYQKRSIGHSTPVPGDWSFDVWSDRVHPDDRKRVMAILNDHLEGRSPLYHAEYRFRTSASGYRWAQSRGRVIEHTDEGRPKRMVGVQRDITQQVELREAHRRQEAQMAHLGRVAAMGETVAGIAHEINQPLHAASTYCAAAREAIRSAADDAPRRAAELCENASEQVRRAGEIIRRIRDFTRPRPAVVAEVDLNQAVEQTLEFVSQLGVTRGVMVTVDGASESLIVAADRVQVQQVLVNLIQNACDSLAAAGDDAPAMIIATNRLDGFAEVLVRDNASTPVTADPEAFFDPFFTTKQDGMGIGLALCRTILTAHGGEIHASPNSDRGMTFRFTLPLAPEQTR